MIKIGLGGMLFALLGRLITGRYWAWSYLDAFDNYRMLKWGHIAIAFFVVFCIGLWLRYKET